MIYFISIRGIVTVSQQSLHTIGHGDMTSNKHFFFNSSFIINKNSGWFEKKAYLSVQLYKTDLDIWSKFW